MKFSSTFAIFTALAGKAVASASVSGAAEGFAKGVSGGGNAQPVYPKSPQDLVSYLGDNQPRVIVLTQTYVTFTFFYDILALVLILFNLGSISLELKELLLKLVVLPGLLEINASLLLI